jgi:acyl-coenzyme A synthetase/AMP-(fatty) acid ligase
MPAYMVPLQIDWLETLPRNPNGKFDRPALAVAYKNAFGAP